MNILYVNKFFHLVEKEQIVVGFFLVAGKAAHQCGVQRSVIFYCPLTKKMTSQKIDVIFCYAAFHKTMS